MLPWFAALTLVAVVLVLARRSSEIRLDTPALQPGTTSAPRLLETVSRLQGEMPAARVVFHDLPVRRNRSGGQRWATGDFGAQLSEALSHPETGLFAVFGLSGGGDWSCAVCGAGLAGAPARSFTQSVQVELPELPPFRVDVTADFAECAACGRSQLRPDDDAGVELWEAIAAAFEGSGIEER